MNLVRAANTALYIMGTDRAPHGTLFQQTQPNISEKSEVEVN